MSHYVDTLQPLLAQHANPADAAPMFRYMRDQFPFLGIKTPARRALREYSKTNADAVLAFIAAAPLPPLSAREGLKWLKNLGRL